MEVREEHEEASRRRVAGLEEASLEEVLEELQGRDTAVQQLQEQVGQLAESQATTDDRYTRVKQDNAALSARIHMLEEHIREVEVKQDNAALTARIHMLEEHI